MCVCAPLKAGTVAEIVCVVLLLLYYVLLGAHARRSALAWCHEDPPPRIHERHEVRRHYRIGAITYDMAEYSALMWPKKCAWREGEVVLELTAEQDVCVSVRRKEGEC